MNKMKFRRNLISRGVALALAGIAAPFVMAQDVSQKSEAETLEEVQVVGFKASLEKSVYVKRNATVVMDSVNAEDIGKFPDKNIGDALMRLPGVGIERRFGEADGVSIRGLDPALSLTYLNGQSISTAQWFEGYRPTRGFRSDMLASELVSSLEVYKSPRADLPDGSVGGIVNIKTRRPLDLAANTFQSSMEYQYTENAERWDPAFSGLYSWKSEDEKFGFLVSASHQERFTTYDAMENYYGTSVEGKDTDGSGNFTQATWGAGHAIFQQERERTAYNITAQYQPSEQLDITANYLNFALSADNVNANYLVIPGRTADIRNVSVVGDFPAGQGALVHDSYLADVNGEPGNDYWFGPDTFFRNTNPEAQAFDIDINYSHELFDAHMQVGYTEAAGDIIVVGYSGMINTQTMAATDLTGEEKLTLDLTGNKLGVEFEGFDPSLPENYPLAIREVNPHMEDSDEETYAQFDITVPMQNAGFITALKTGVKYQDHTNDRHVYFFDAEIPANLMAGVATYADLPVNSGCGQFDETAKSNTLTCLPTLSLSGIRDLTGELTPANTRQTESLSDFYEINEQKLAVYGMAEFEYEKFSGNFGLRYVDYDLESIAHQDDALNVPTNNDYSEVLPSLNVVYEIQEDLLLRGAAARVMSLPNYQDLRNTFSYNSLTLTGSAGNPYLDPWLANQLDLGIEWYFADGALASATYFRKDIDSFLFSITEEEVHEIVLEGTDTVVTRPLLVSRNRNGGEAKLQGLELQLQTELGYGFGMSANYTFTDAEVIDNNGVDGLNLPGNSDKMWNVTTYWENDRYSARLMANQRGEFFSGLRLGSATETEAFTSVDVAFSAEVTDNVTLSLQGINLTGELYRTKNTEDSWNGLFRQINDNGTRWFANVAVKF
ncbi:TonB-dependent receptor [Microbulbifer aggregans]|uniref:TonB-dependent receptor n=1 Tax=Microbulbifer aggregans TaxID=1769779 RepID=UPI001CFF2C1A|nr:TonB-dependent receptor [Microbulbifer aggregans]